MKLPEGKPLLSDLDLLNTAGEINASFHTQMKNEQMAMKSGYLIWKQLFVATC